MFKKILFLLFWFLFSTEVIFAVGIYDSNKYAGGEDIGGVNFKADSGNVDVDSHKLSGYIGNDNYGGINLAPDNGGVLNDGKGDLSGYAGGENLGGINFNNVSIDIENGFFHGTASSDDNGLITFDGDNVSVKTYGMKTYQDNCKEHSVQGFAWSNTIGGISFDCKSANSYVDYGVDVDKNGNLSGFAWSDSIGGIDFSYYGGDSKAGYNSNSKKLYGKIKALAGLSDSDDSGTGTIALNGVADDGYNFAPIYDNNTFEFDDFAGGDEIVGGIDFKTDYSVVTMDPFYFRFYSNKGQPGNQVPAGGSVVLSGDTESVVSCSASKGEGTSGTDTNPKSAGEPSTATEQVSNLDSDKIFDLTCTNSEGTNLTKEVKVGVAPPQPELSLGSEKTNIPSNTSTILHFKIKDTKNCRLTSSSGIDRAVDSSDGEHTEDTGNLTESTNGFTITCDAEHDEEYPVPIEDTVYIDVEKLIVEFYPEANPIRFRGNIKLFGKTEYAPNCNVSGDLNEFVDYFSTASYDEVLRDGTKTEKEVEEGKRYVLEMECTGTQGQKVNKKINLKIGRNPVFGEV